MTRATILMTVYNAAPYLQECINSMLKQSFTDFEFWIIDDASNDGSSEIIKSQTDNRIKKFFNQENIGIALSLNQYLHQIKSDYIFRMDADDISLPYRLEKQITFMDANPNIGISGGALQYFGNANYSWFPAIDHKDISARLLFNCAVPNPTLVMRTSCIAKHNLLYDTSFPKPPMEDYALLIDSMNLFEFGNLNDILVKHREHSTNQSTLYPNQKKESMTRIYEKLFRKLQIEVAPYILLIHYQLTYNLPDFKEQTVFDYIDWSDHLLKVTNDPASLRKVLRFYLVKLLKHLKYKPVSAVRLFLYIVRL